MSTQTNQSAALTVQDEKNITDGVLAKIKLFQETGDIKLPDNYNVANAMKSAFLVLSEQTTRDGKSVLQACTKTSVANALLKMAIQGLSLIKNQCYFIPYGDKLTMIRSYFGSVALAKRVANVKDVPANIIYQGDVFEYEISTDTGKIKVLKHEQKIENIDLGKIKGAYATVINADGTTETTIMTQPQIMKAWQQGTMKGNSGAHNNFTDEMAKKTVIQRACKEKINTSNDNDLYDDDEKDVPVSEAKASVQNEIKNNANKAETISFENTEKKEEPITSNNEQGNPIQDAVEVKENITPGQQTITDFP